MFESLKELDRPRESVYSSEELALLRAHFAIQITRGIHDSYLSSMDNYYQSRNPNSSIAQAARSEAPLRLILQKDWFTNQEGLRYGTGYFLEKFDPISGAAVVDEDDEEAICWAAFLNKDGSVIQKSDNFTDEQIEILFQQGQELIDIGMFDSD